MTQVWYILVATAFAVVLMLLSTTLPKLHWRVWAALTIALIAPLAIGGFTASRILGYPQPTEGRIFGLPIGPAIGLINGGANSIDASVLAVTYANGQAIWLWVQPPNSRTPVAIELPWDNRVAENLQGLRRKQQEQRGKQGQFELRMAKSFDTNEMKFYEVPAPMPPAKEGGEKEQENDDNYI